MLDLRVNVHRGAVLEGRGRDAPLRATDDGAQPTFTTPRSYFPMASFKCCVSAKICGSVSSVPHVLLCESTSSIGMRLPHSLGTRCSEHSHTVRGSQCHTCATLLVHALASDSAVKVHISCHRVICPAMRSVIAIDDPSTGACVLACAGGSTSTHDSCPTAV